MSLDALTGCGAHATPPAVSGGPPLEATIATAPVTMADTVDVLIGATNLRVGPCRWEPVATRAALLFPVVGRRCLVVMSNHGQQTVVWWDPATTGVTSGALRPSLVTTLPGSPAAGDECYLQTAAMAALTPALMWHLRYSGTAWVPFGAVPVFSEIDNYTTTPASGPDRAVTSATYVALAVALTVALPTIGWYDIELAFSGYHSVAGGLCAMSYDIGATPAVDADAIGGQVAVAGTDVQRHTISRRRLFASAATLTAKFRTISGTATFRGPKSMTATPVLLG